MTTGAHVVAEQADPTRRLRKPPPTRAPGSWHAARTLHPSAALGGRRCDVAHGDSMTMATSAISVLLVDDSAALRHLLTQVLRANGFVPIHAASAEEALKAATAAPPDVVVVDQHLPGLSGSELIRMLRSSSVERRRSVPVVGLSGRDGSAERLLDAGASCFIAKPFHDSDLLDAIRWISSARGDEPKIGRAHV